MVLEPLGTFITCRSETSWDCSLSSMPASSKELWSWWHWCLNFTSPKSPVASTFKKKRQCQWLNKGHHTPKKTPQKSEVSRLASALSISATKGAIPQHFCTQNLQPCGASAVSPLSGPGLLPPITGGVEKKNTKTGDGSTWCSFLRRTYVHLPVLALTMWTMWWSEYFSMQKKNMVPNGAKKIWPIPMSFAEAKTAENTSLKKIVPPVKSGHKSYARAGRL